MELQLLRKRLREYESEFTITHGRRPCTKEEWGDEWPTFVSYRVKKQEMTTSKASPKATPTRPSRSSLLPLAVSESPPLSPARIGSSASAATLEED